MTGRVSKRTKQIWDMYNSGKSNGQISKALGVNYSLVTSAVSRGRDAAVIPPLQVASPLCYGSPKYCPRGTMGFVVTRLTRGQQAWLSDKATEWQCDSFAEVILEIVRDAHAEELKGQDDE